MSSIAIAVGSQGMSALSEAGIMAGRKLARKVNGRMVKKNM
ncbi:MAG: hypothetical protein R3293_18625 [Candidatus Promineifilaceae bacterium]|nr:hypothetical protein [Candidatus Promineifilaceae bacterium]